MKAKITTATAKGNQKKYKISLLRTNICKISRKNP